MVAIIDVACFVCFSLCVSIIENKQQLMPGDHSLQAFTSRVIVCGLIV